MGRKQADHAFQNSENADPACLACPARADSVCAGRSGPARFLSIGPRRATIRRPVLQAGPGSRQNDPRRCSCPLVSDLQAAAPDRRTDREGNTESRGLRGRFRHGKGCAQALSRSVPKHADRLQGHQGSWPLDRRHRCRAYPCARRKGILTMAELGGLALSYAAGALSTLSPCVLPLLPIILLGALEQHAWGPIALAAGLSASFAGVGIFLVSLGYSLGIDPTAFRLGAAALILIIGIVLLFPALQNRFALAAAPVALGGQALIKRLRPSRIGGQFALGMLLGAIWSPCSGPTLGAAIGLAAQPDAIFGLARRGSPSRSSAPPSLASACLF